MGHHDLNLPFTIYYDVKMNDSIVLDLTGYLKTSH